MRRNRLLPASAVAGSVAVLLALSACSGTPDAAPSEEDYVSGGTFIKATSSDIGTLIPMTAVAPDEREVINYAYESLVYATPDGELIPWLAESWTETGTTVTFQLREGITCSDGTPFDASVAAANFNYHADPANASWYFGSIIAEGLTAEGSGLEVTVTVPSNDPFILANMGLVEMVCQAGLDDPQSLQDSTNGTGLFALEEIQAQSSFIFQKRDDYTWGPNGVTSETEGLPDTIEVRIIPDESTGQPAAVR